MFKGNVIVFYYCAFASIVELANTEIVAYSVQDSSLRTQCAISHFILVKFS